MLYLLEATYTDKETQALYSNYATEIEIVGALETKLGQQIKSEGCKAELLIAFDGTGRIIKQAYHTKDDSVELSNRLVWITKDAEGEHPNMQKYDSALETEANYHLKRGSAMTGEGTDAIFAMVINDHNIAVGLDEYWVRPIEYVEPEPEEVTE